MFIRSRKKRKENFYDLYIYAYMIQVYEASKIFARRLDLISLLYQKTFSMFLSNAWLHAADTQSLGLLESKCSS